MAQSPRAPIPQVRGPESLALQLLETRPRDLSEIFFHVVLKRKKDEKNSGREDASVTTALRRAASAVSSVDGIMGPSIPSVLFSKAFFVFEASREEGEEGERVCLLCVRGPGSNNNIAPSMYLDDGSVSWTVFVPPHPSQL